VFAVSGLGVYGIILSGWSSNSRYAFFGALRSAAQMISYEVSIGLILVAILVVVGSLNFVDIVLFQNYIFFAIPFFSTFLNVSGFDSR
jgi:NADH-quinone oxidoreductase subunit H